MLGFGRNKAQKRPVYKGRYVVVLAVPGEDVYAGKPRPLDEALRVFAGTLRETPAGVFQPDKPASMRVMRETDWLAARTAQYALEAE
jgi:hypothetical protein